MNQASSRICPLIPDIWDTLHVNADLHCLNITFSRLLKSLFMNPWCFPIQPVCMQPFLPIGLAMSSIKRKHISDRLHCITNTFVVPIMFPLTMLFLSFSEFVAIIDIALSASIPPTATQHLADQHITAAFGVYNKTIQFTLPPRHQIHQLHRLRLVQTPLCSFF